MPLTELLKMYKEKLDSTHKTASTSTDPSCRTDTDCVELVWENGQIVMQSSKARKDPVSNNFQPFIPKSQDIRNGQGSRMPKFGTMDSVLPDFSLPVPSSDMGLDQGIDMVSWLNYPIEDQLHNDCTSDFLHELSGVTINDLSTENHLASRDKKSNSHGEGHTSVFNNDMTFKFGSTRKVPSTTEKHTRDGGGSEVPQFSLPFQHNVLKSGISNVTGSNTGNPENLTSRESIPTTSSLSAFTSLRLQKLDAGQPSTSSGFTNFSYFSRPTVVARAHHPTVNGSNKLENDDKRCAFSSNADSNLVSGGAQKDIQFRNQSVLAPVNGTSKLLRAKSTEELMSSNQATYVEDVARNDASQNQACGATNTTTRMVAEKNTEPVVATSSVGSGNNVETTSNEPAHNLKRKYRETGESEGPSEEFEEESVGAKKSNPSRTGAKRSRAAEVHNLSERRRRDRINEKMRALQELIPNCNKVDKASMLDEAIEYLKTLQLQVQMLSMGAGLYMQPMMMPPGMQPIHGAHMPHLSPMGVGMGMGMGYGMNMFDVNSGVKMMPFQGPHYPVPGAGPNFHGMPGSSLQAFGHPGQGLPVAMQRPPVLPVSGVPSANMPMGPNISGVAGAPDAAHVAPPSSSKDVGTQVMPNNNVNNSVSQAPNKATNKDLEHPVTSNDQAQLVNASEAALAISTTNTMPS